MDLKDCKPCPFCGNQTLRWDTVAHTYGRYETVAVACDYVLCDMVGPSGLSRDQAVAKWNRRDGEEQK